MASPGWDTPPTAEEMAGFDPDAYLRQKGAKWAQDPIVPNWAQAPTVEEWERARRVTDPALLARLEGGQRVTDPRLLRQLEGPPKWANDPIVGEPPGLLSRAAAWATTPFRANDPLIAENKRIAAGSGGLVGKDSPDWLAGAARFVSAIPGFQPYATSQDFDQRLARFGAEHPKTSLALALAGGMAKPLVLPPVARAPAAAEQVVPAVAQSVAVSGEQAVNGFEAAARSTKVGEMVKAIDANAGAHLGVDARDPRFAQALADMPGEWWDGIAQVAKVNKPSEETVGQVLNFYKDRAAQGARAVAEAAPTSSATAEAAALSTLSSQLRDAGTALGNIPRSPISLIDLLMGGHGYAHGGAMRAAAMVAASKLARNYGPPIAGSMLKGAAGVLEKTPTPAMETAAQTLRAVLEAARQRSSDERDYQ